MSNYYYIVITEFNEVTKLNEPHELSELSDDDDDKHPNKADCS